MFLDDDERLLPLNTIVNPLTLGGHMELADVGIKTIMLSSWVYWDEIEPIPGEYDWNEGNVEDAIELARKANLKVLVNLYRRAPEWLSPAGKAECIYNEGSWEVTSWDGARPYKKSWLSINPFHAETLEIELEFLDQACRHFSIPGEVQCAYSIPYGAERILPFRLGEYTEQMCIDVVLARQEVFAKYSDGLWSAYHPFLGMASSSINASIDPHVGNEHAPAVYAAMCERFPDNAVNRILYGFFDHPGSWDRRPLPGVKTWVGAEYAAAVATNAKRLNAIGMWGMVMACQPGRTDRVSAMRPHTVQELGNISKAVEILSDGLEEAQEMFMDLV